MPKLLRASIRYRLAPDVGITPIILVDKALINRCLDEGTVVYTKHIRDELANDDLTTEDVLGVCGSGAVLIAPDKDIKTGRQIAVVFTANLLREVFITALALANSPARLTGGQFRFLRKHLGFTGDEFGRYLHTDRTKVSKWERSDDQLVRQQTGLSACLRLRHTTFAQISRAA